MTKLFKLKKYGLSLIALLLISFSLHAGELDSYYETLGLKPDSSKVQIENAYQAHVLLRSVLGPVPAKFKQAYQILIHYESRLEYYNKLLGSAPLSPLQEQLVHSVTLLEVKYNVVLDSGWTSRLREATDAQLEFFLRSLQGLERALAYEAYPPKRRTVPKKAVSAFAYWEKSLEEPINFEDLKYIELIHYDEYVKVDYQEGIFNLFLARKGGMPQRVYNLVQASLEPLAPAFQALYLPAFSLAISRVQNSAQLAFAEKMMDYFVKNRPDPWLYLAPPKGTMHDPNDLFNGDLAAEVMKRISYVTATTDADAFIELLSNPATSIKQSRDLARLDNFFSVNSPGVCGAFLVKKFLGN